MIWRLERVLRLIVPGATGAGAAAAHLASGGSANAALFCAVAGGLVLGWAIVVGHECLQTLAGKRRRDESRASRRLAELERDKDALLRHIKEVELDAELQRSGRAETAELVAPLRQRALALLREIDEAREESTMTVEEQIDTEIERRVVTSTRSRGSR